MPVLVTARGEQLRSDFNNIKTARGNVAPGKHPLGGGWVYSSGGSPVPVSVMETYPLEPRSIGNCTVKFRSGIDGKVAAHAVPPVSKAWGLLASRASLEEALLFRQNNQPAIC